MSNTYDYYLSNTYDYHHRLNNVKVRLALLPHLADLVNLNDEVDNELVKYIVERSGLVYDASCLTIARHLVDSQM